MKHFQEARSGGLSPALVLQNEMHFVGGAASVRAKHDDIAWPWRFYGSFNSWVEGDEMHQTFRDMNVGRMEGGNRKAFREKTIEHLLNHIKSIKNMEGGKKNKHIHQCRQ